MTNSRVQKTGTINKNKIEKIIRQLLVELGENPDREGLIGTPKRIAEMYEEIFSGYKMNSELDVSFSEETNAIIAKDIQFYSMCEHHMLPFYGRVHIAYVPNGKVFGLSKLVRLAEKYSRRMQIQERLTTEIADEISKRGVRNNNSIITIAYRGIFEEKGIRENILNLIYTKQNHIINV